MLLTTPLYLFCKFIVARGNTSNPMRNVVCSHTNGNYCIFVLYGFQGEGTPHAASYITSNEHIGSGKLRFPCDGVNSLL